MASREERLSRKEKRKTGRRGAEADERKWEKRRFLEY